MLGLWIFINYTFNIPRDFPLLCISLLLGETYIEDIKLHFHNMDIMALCSMSFMTLGPVSQYKNKEQFICEAFVFQIDSSSHVHTDTLFSDTITSILYIIANSLANFAVSEDSSRFTIVLWGTGMLLTQWLVFIRCWSHDHSHNGKQGWQGKIYWPVHSMDGVYIFLCAKFSWYFNCWALIPIFLWFLRQRPSLLPKLSVIS